MKFASLCILAYKRPEKLEQCLTSLHRTIDFPCEVIINIDGMSPEDQKPVLDVVMQSQGYSKLIVASGKNRGVGRSFQNCLGVAEGDYIFKIDTDLIFRRYWLSTAINILKENRDIGAVSLFDYKHYDEADIRFNMIEERTKCFIVNDFVSSIFAFRAEEIPMFGTIPDDGLHQVIADEGKRKLAITKEDYVTNNGFGLGKSVYVVADANGKPVKATTYSKPLLFDT